MKININHQVSLYPQPSKMSCWSAAATMLFGDRCVAQGKAKLATVLHEVVSGESLIKIAKLYGVFKWQDIYNHPLNADFKKKRPNPNVIQPGDKIYVPTHALQMTYANLQAFANAHGLTMHAPMSWSVEGLAQLLSRCPLMVCGLMPSGHAVVLAGMRGDGTPRGTFLTIYDPWPPNIGRIIRNISYQDLMTQFPMFTNYILHR